MTSVLYEKKQLQQLRMKRTAQKNASAPEQEGKTAELLAKELGVTKRHITRVIAELWGADECAELTADDLVMVEGFAGGLAKEKGGAQAQKVLAKVSEKLAYARQKMSRVNVILSKTAPRATKNVARQCDFKENGAISAKLREKIVALEQTKTVAENATVKGDFKIPAPRKALINRNWTYIITEQQEALIRCLLVPNRIELAQHVARMDVLTNVLWQVATEAQLSSDRFEFALDLREQPALRDDASRVAELEQQVAELKNKVVAKHEALLRMEGERNAYKDLYLGAISGTNC